MTDVPGDPEPLVIRVGDDQGRGGLYNMVVPGGFDRGEVLLPILGFTSWDEVGRFRDAWVERSPDGTYEIRLYTRNGGGNREEFAAVNAALAAHPGYLRDADDEFDPTYASFWFRPPDDMTELLGQVAVPPVDTGRWWALLARQAPGEPS